MLCSITGDIIGSVYEFDFRTTAYYFPLLTEGSFFTEDTFLTAVLADSILSNINYKVKLCEYYHLYSHCSYGSRFHLWAAGKEQKPYNSWGSGSVLLAGLLMTWQQY
jgi:hypothetical protein